MVQDYIPPEFELDGFNCPHCGAFAHQEWRMSVRAKEYDGGGSVTKLDSISASICARCEEFALWDDARLIFPSMYLAHLPATDMPKDVKDDYEEARSIFSQSSRGAAALLRLAIQKLVIELDESGDNLNENIGNLVKKGLSERIQKPLDIVRVIGNNAVHPGQINVEDNPEIALKLFRLINIIVEQMITQPKEVSELYDDLPEGAKNAIAKRDGVIESE